MMFLQKELSETGTFFGDCFEFAAF